MISAPPSFTRAIDKAIIIYTKGDLSSASCRHRSWACSAPHRRRAAATQKGPRSRESEGPSATRLNRRSFLDQVPKLSVSFIVRPRRKIQSPRIDTRRGSRRERQSPEPVDRDHLLVRLQLAEEMAIRREHVDTTVPEIPDQHDRRGDVVVAIAVVPLIRGRACLLLA